MSAAGARSLAAAGTVAVLLPTAYFTLRQTTPPPVPMLREAGVAMAVATDCNPGSSPCTSILLALNMACTLFGLTPQEALSGATRNAARALGAAETSALSRSASGRIWRCGVSSGPRNCATAWAPIPAPEWSTAECSGRIEFLHDCGYPNLHEPAIK